MPSRHPSIALTVPRDEGPGDACPAHLELDGFFNAEKVKTRDRLNFQPPATRSSAAGFTIIEVMIVVAIIGTLAAIAVPSLLHVMFRAKVVRAIVDIQAIEGDVDAFELENGRTPSDLAEINRENLRDPWGNPYRYLSFAAVGPSWRGSARKDHSLVPLNSSYDLYSTGPDGDTAGPLTARPSRDDIVRANDGGFVGPASEF